MAFRWFSWLHSLTSKKHAPSPTDPHLALIHQRAEDILASDLPLQQQEEALLRLCHETVNMQETLSIRAHADYIADVMANRNFEGSTLERLRQADKAIELYEANVQDRYKGAYPYERLLALYASAGKFQDARRICQAYIDHGQGDEDRKAKFREWMRAYA
jgi:hypothetical protein